LALPAALKKLVVLNRLDLNGRIIANAPIEQLRGAIRSSECITGKPDRTRFSAYRESPADRDVRGHNSSDVLLF
jgi:hypothetical protein